MTDLMGSSEGEETTGKRDNFIGRVEFSRVNCTCEDCAKGDDAASKAGVDEEDLQNDIDHLFRVEALTEYDGSSFNVFGIDVSTSWQSKWQVFTAFFENNIGTFNELGLESTEDITDYLEGRVFEFRDVTFEEDEELTWEHSPNGHTEVLGEMFDDGEYSPNSILVPVREITDDQKLAELGVTDDGEVEEVDF